MSDGDDMTTVSGVTLGELSGGDVTNVSGATLDEQENKVPTLALVCTGIHYERTAGTTQFSRAPQMAVANC